VTQYEDVNDGDTTWRFETDFLQSNWTCIWGRGCKGIEATVDTEKQHGCCSLGAELDGIDEAMDLAAHAALLSPENFQFHAQAMSSKRGCPECSQQHDLLFPLKKEQSKQTQ
jgi:hypothetical protein